MQIIDLDDLGVGDVGEGIGEPGMGFDGIEFGCLDQGIDDGCRLAARRGANEEAQLMAWMPPPDGIVMCQCDVC